MTEKEEQEAERLKKILERMTRCIRSDMGTAYPHLVMGRQEIEHGMAVIECGTDRDALDIQIEVERDEDFRETMEREGLQYERIKWGMPGQPALMIKLELAKRIHGQEKK